MKRGVAHVYKGGVKLAAFKEGDYFGELALLMNQPRTASVVAVTDLMMLSLSSSDLDTVTSLFPVARVRIEAAAAERMKLIARTDPSTTRREEEQVRYSTATRLQGSAPPKKIADEQMEARLRRMAGRGSPTKEMTKEMSSTQLSRKGSTEMLPEGTPLVGMAAAGYKKRLSSSDLRTSAPSARLSMDGGDPTRSSAMSLAPEQLEDGIAEEEEGFAGEEEGGARGVEGGGASPQGARSKKERQRSVDSQLDMLDELEDAQAAASAQEQAAGGGGRTRTAMGREAAGDVAIGRRTLGTGLGLARRASGITSSVMSKVLGRGRGSGDEPPAGPQREMSFRTNTRTAGELTEARLLSVMKDVVAPLQTELADTREMLQKQAAAHAEIRATLAKVAGGEAAAVTTL